VLQFQLKETPKSVG